MSAQKTSAAKTSGRFRSMLSASKIESHILSTGKEIAHRNLDVSPQ